MKADALLGASIREQGAAFREARLSPVELTEAYLARSEKVGPALGAYATLMRERALSEARIAEKELRAGRDRGPLHGVPYAAKDLLAAKGAPTGWGSKTYAAQRFDEDATAIARLRDAGAVLVGKAAMIELAGGMGYRFASASASGASRNPWSKDRWTCGSSSGSAVIASASLATFALGSETWGSIVCPAAFCGLSGLRPTYGRVSRHGAMALSYTMDKIGVLARSADDCELVLAALAAHDPADPASLADAAFRPAPSPRPPRLGVPRDLWKNVPKEIGRLFEAALGELRAAGASMRDVRLPVGPWDEAAAILIGVEGAAAFASFIDAGRPRELVDPLGRVGAFVNRCIPASDHVRAQQVRAQLQSLILRTFADVDVLVAPSLPATATTLDANLETALDFPDPLGSIGNLCGLPAISVPCGFDGAALPVGLLFVGKPMADGAVLAAARLYQARTKWHLQRPPV